MGLHEEIRRVAHDVWQGTEPPAHFDQAMADALVPLVERRLAEVRAEYESALSWGTTCLNCAKNLDQSYEDWVGGNKAGIREAQAVVEAALRLISPDHITPMGARQVRKAVEGLAQGQASELEI